MLIIDCHCHAGEGDGFTGPWDTRAPLKKFMQWSHEAGIHKTVLFPAFHTDYSRANKLVADIVKNQELLKLQDKIVRLPGRNMWRIDGRSKNDGASGIETADGLSKLGYKVIGWDLEWSHHPKDGTPVQSVQTIYKSIVNQLENKKTFTKDNIVVLIH